MTTITTPSPDVVILGGGAAGSSAALVLGRARADVLLIDDGSPANAPAEGIGGLLGHDGTPPAAFLERAAEEISRYPTTTRHHATAVSIEPSTERRWAVGLEGGGNLENDRVLLALGMQYDTPAIDGIGPRWGASVFHCPFCHGWEHRHRPLAILGGNQMTVERSLLLRRWSDDLTLVTGPAELSDDDRSLLEQAGIRVVEGEIAALEGPDRALAALVLTDGSEVTAEGLMVPAPHTMRHPDLVDGLGLATEPSGHLTTDGFGRTTATGIWAAGDITSPIASVARAVADGSLCAAAITHDLVATDHALVHA